MNERDVAQPTGLARTSAYDGYVDAYAAYVARREEGGPEQDPLGILPHLLDLLGDVARQTVLDAGCGEGYLARILAARGARVTGIDLSPRLLELARAKSPGGVIDYRLADLSLPQPDLAQRFDTVASYLVLNDVEDYQGFLTTLSQALKPGGRLVLALNNPYGAVVRGHVADYFASGTVSPYRGLWAAGIEVFHYHRTLQEYLDACLSNGLCLTRLVDVPVTDRGAALPEGYRFPRFMVLAFGRR